MLRQPRRAAECAASSNLLQYRPESFNSGFEALQAPCASRTKVLLSAFYWEAGFLRVLGQRNGVGTATGRATPRDEVAALGPRVAVWAVRVHGAAHCVRRCRLNRQLCKWSTTAHHMRPHHRGSPLPIVPNSEVKLGRVWVVLPSGGPHGSCNHEFGLYCAVYCFTITYTRAPKLFILAARSTRKYRPRLSPGSWQARRCRSVCGACLSIEIDLSPL